MIKIIMLKKHHLNNNAWDKSNNKIDNLNKSDSK